MEFLFPLLATVLVLYPNSRLYRIEKQAKADEMKRDSAPYSGKYASWKSIVATEDGYDVICSCPLISLYIIDFDIMFSYDEFSNFLVREFATQNLLFVTEVCLQFSVLINNLESSDLVQFEKEQEVNLSAHASEIRLGVGHSMSASNDFNVT